MSFSWKKALWLILVVCTMTKAAGDDDGPFQKIHAQYDELSPKGKLAAGTAVGFVGSRLALSTVTKVVKVGAAAFISAEVLKMTGVLDDLPSFSAEQNDMITKVKGTVLQKTEDFRIQMRRNLNRESVETFFDKERMAALGVAGGAIAGAIL